MSAIVRAAPAISSGGVVPRARTVGGRDGQDPERYAPGLGELVEARQVVTPEDFEVDFGLTGGHVQHAEPGLDQFFAWRPLNGKLGTGSSWTAFTWPGPAPTRAAGSRAARVRTPPAGSARTGDRACVRAEAGDDRRERPAVPDPGEHALRGRRRRVRRVRHERSAAVLGLPGSFYKVPWALDEEAIRDAGADIAIVGAPYDEGTSARPGARFGPMAIRTAHVTAGSPGVVAPDGGIPLRRPHGGRCGRRADRPGATRAQPARDPRFVGSLAPARCRSSWAATTGSRIRPPPRSPGCTTRRRRIVHFDAHADTAMDQWGS